MASQDSPVNGMFDTVHDRRTIGFHYPERGVRYAADRRDQLFYGVLFFYHGRGEIREGRFIDPFCGYVAGGVYIGAYRDLSYVQSDAGFSAI